MAKFFNSIIETLAKVGQHRANAELRRMGYTPESLAKMTNENLNRWV